jgi:hypothetical protein
MWVYRPAFMRKLCFSFLFEDKLFFFLFPKKVQRSQIGMQVM